MYNVNDYLFVHNIIIFIIIIMNILIFYLKYIHNYVRLIEHICKLFIYINIVSTIVYYIYIL